MAIKRAASGDEFVAKVTWEGVEEAKSTWEPVSRLFHDAPAVRHKEFKALRMKAEQKRARVQRYGLLAILYIVIWGGIQDYELLIFLFFLHGVSALGADSA